jgi:hypothetical protein
MWFMVLLFIGTGIRGGYGVLQNRHEQELRISSRRTRQAENQLRKWEIRYRVALQENEKLNAKLASQQALLAQLRADLERTSPVLLARRR